MAHSDNPNLQLFIDRLTGRSLLTDAEKQAILNLPCNAVQGKRSLTGSPQAALAMALRSNGLSAAFVSIQRPGVR